MAVADQVLSALAERHPPAMFYTELQAALRGAPELPSAVAELESSKAVLVSAFPAPDVHLEGIDLRIVALAPAADETAALEATSSLWADWVRAFLANHRCGA